MGKEETNVSRVIDAISEGMAYYDENMRELLADPQILSRILKYSLQECRDMTPEEIMACIGDDVEVGTAPLDPGLSNLQKVKGANTEDIVLNEGRNYYDIRCSLNLKKKGRKKPVRILLNLEAQNRTTEGRLRYPLENRIIFYLARMISAQKGTEFVRQDYRNMKKVVAIWICTDAESDGDSVSMIRLKQDILFGKAKQFSNLGLIKAIVVNIRTGKNLKRSENELVAMMEDLIAQETPKQKKKKLNETYGIVMTQELEGRIDDMCNFSTIFVEQGISQGISQGMERGELRKLVDQVCRKIAKEKTPEVIAEELEEKPETIQRIYETALKHAPEYNVDAIVDELLSEDAKVAV